MIVPINITGGSYKSRSLPLSAQVTRNLYPEVQENQQTKSPYVLQPFPGYLSFADSTSAADRGIFPHQDYLYQVSGTTLYSIASNGTRTSLGTIIGSEDCIFAGISSSIVVVTEGTVYVWDGVTLTTVTDPDLETPDSCAHINNQILFDGDEGRFVSAAVGDATDIPALNYATAESNADNLKRVYAMGSTVYMMGDRTIEQWWNSGSGSPPFDRIQGGTIPVGLHALRSVADNGDVMYFLGHDLRVWAVSGSSKKIVSTIPLSSAIKGYGTRTNEAIGSYFVVEGQGFYCITFPFGDKTWCFHEQSGEWFEISSGADGGRAIFNYAVNCFGRALAADRLTSEIYELDVDTFDENGSTIHRVRDTGPIHGGLFGKPGAWLEMNKFELIMETGVGDLTDTPEVMISWSDDGGRTFGTEVYGTVNVGTAGQYQKKVEVFCMGGFYERIIRVRMTEAVRWSIHSAAAEIEVGI